jgi:hypothetical protein
VAFSEIDRHPVAVTGSAHGTLRVWNLHRRAGRGDRPAFSPSALAATSDATTVISTRKGILAIKFSELQEVK